MMVNGSWPYTIRVAQSGARKYSHHRPKSPKRVSMATNTGLCMARYSRAFCAWLEIAPELDLQISSIYEESLVFVGNELLTYSNPQRFQRWAHLSLALPDIGAAPTCRSGNTQSMMWSQRTMPRFCSRHLRTGYRMCVKVSVAPI